eukprot:CAMPEP_0173076670 /NCGR_PEP_ID=MMETSP1102-20130122/12592_1 /TAXON_ID=49646 /ORGANISM="Geminigera sp., Strain Caron Lab Isolate" /LENGTH=46 /DNA_ID= /DNA_START= /DNA_END= /DNA_ORIENTATION=
MTEDDFSIITDAGKHLNTLTQEFGKVEFRNMMKGELWRYSRRQLAN